MGVREKLNDSQVGIVVGAALIVLAIAIGAWYLKPASRPNPSVANYSDDDGQSYFQDSIYKFPPFDHGGKVAVLAQLYQDYQGNRFVGCLLRYTPEAQKKLQDKYTQSQGAPNQVQLMTLAMSDPSVAITGMELKYRGSDKKWLPYSQNLVPSVVSPSGDPHVVPVQGQ